MRSDTIASTRVFRSAYGDVCIIEKTDDYWECCIDYGCEKKRARFGSFEDARRYMRQNVRDWTEV